MLPSTRSWIRRHVSVLVAVVVVLIAVSAVAQVDNTWDWDKNARWLYLEFDNAIIVAPSGSVNSDVGGLPDPNPVNGNFFIGDAVARAAFAWNSTFAANPLLPKWTISLVQPPVPPPPGVQEPYVTIRVRMGFTGLDADADHQNPNGNEFSPVPTPLDPYTTPTPVPSASAKAVDPDNQNGGANPPPEADAWAFFRRGPVAVGQTGPDKGQIVFNNYAPWGVDTNQQGVPGAPIDGYIDPAIIALHELGHAMRLDHVGTTAIGDPPPAPGIDGPVMRARFHVGHHRINADATWSRNPDGLDVAAARQAAQVPVGGKKMQMKDKPGMPGKRQMGVLIKDSALDTTSFDPVANGATIAVFNPGTGESECLSLPSISGTWRVVGSATSRKYKYKDALFTYGPCNTALVSNGKLLKLNCKAKVQPIGYSLDEPAQGSVAVSFTSGARTYCAVFGGTVKKDSGTDPPVTGGKGQFLAQDAPAPLVCPTPPSPCP